MANDDCHSEASDDLPLPEGWSVVKHKDTKLYAHHDSKIMSRVHPTRLSKSKNESTPGQSRNGSLIPMHVDLPQEDERPFDKGRSSPSSPHHVMSDLMPQLRQLQQDKDGLQSKLGEQERLISRLQAQNQSLQAQNQDLNSSFGDGAPVDQKEVGSVQMGGGASQNPTVLAPQVGRAGVRGTSAGNLKVLVRCATDLPSSVHGVENVFVRFACRPQVELAKCRVVSGAHPVWDEEVALPICALDRAMMVEVCHVSYDKSSNHVIARSIMNIDVVNQVPCIGPLVLALMDDAGCELGADALLTLQVIETPWTSATPRALQWHESSSVPENSQETKRTSRQRGSILNVLSFPNGSASAMAPEKQLQMIRQVCN